MTITDSPHAIAHIRRLRGSLYPENGEEPGDRTIDPDPSLIHRPATSEAGTNHRTRNVGSKRIRRQYSSRATAFVAGTKSLDHVLAKLPADETTRVMVCGAPGGGTIGGLRAWTYDLNVAGWSPSPSGHYLEDPRRAGLRFVSDTGGRADLIMSLGWFGDTVGSGDPTKCRQAWEAIAELGAQRFGGGPMLNSPAGTGREWWQRTIPSGREWPVLDEQAAAVIRETAGQGRIQMLDRAPDQLDRLVELDGRLMYGSLCWAMPTGLRIWDECQPGDYAANVRARYRVRVTVPDGWDHVGILAARSDDPLEACRYPSTAGETFECWADGSELHVCATYGWHFDVLERMIFNEGKPLDRWANTLVELAMAADDPLVRAGLRSILLHGIGAFHSHARPITHTLPVEQSADIPAQAINPRIEGPVIAWTEQAEAARPELHHPEWTATIWARARARLLHSGRLGTGALLLPVDQLVAFRTDAIWATTDPGWADDGKAGRFRTKTVIEGPLRRPRTGIELLEAKNQRSDG